MTSSSAIRDGQRGDASQAGPQRFYTRTADDRRYTRSTLEDSEAWRAFQNGDADGACRGSDGSASCQAELASTPVDETDTLLVKRNLFLRGLRWRTQIRREITLEPSADTGLDLAQEIPDDCIESKHLRACMKGSTPIRAAYRTRFQESTLVGIGDVMNTAVDCLRGGINLARRIEPMREARAGMPTLEPSAAC
jgi:hypothetical protein